MANDKRLYRSDSGFDVVVRTEQERRAVYEPSSDRVLDLLSPMKHRAKIVRGRKSNTVILLEKIAQKRRDQRILREKQHARASITSGTTARRAGKGAGGALSSPSNVSGNDWRSS